MQNSKVLKSVKKETDNFMDICLDDEEEGVGGNRNHVVLQSPFNVGKKKIQMNAAANASGGSHGKMAQDRPKKDARSRLNAVQ